MYFKQYCVLYELIKDTSTLTKSPHIGTCILELRKVMYEFHYNYIKNKHGKPSRLLSQILIV